MALIPFALVEYRVGVCIRGALSERSAILSSPSPPHEYEEMESHAQASRSWRVMGRVTMFGLPFVLPSYAGSRSVPTNEAVRSHTKCGSDVCPHVDLMGNLDTNVTWI